MDLIAYERLMDKIETVEQIGILICEKLGINLQETAQNQSNQTNINNMASNNTTAQNNNNVIIPSYNPNPFSNSQG